MDSNYTTYSTNQPLDKKILTSEEGGGHKRIPSYIKTIPLTKMGALKTEDERKKVFDTIASKIAQSNQQEEQLEFKEEQQVNRLTIGNDIPTQEKTNLEEDTFPYQSTTPSMNDLKQGPNEN